MPSNTAYVGMAVTSPYNNYLTTAKFDNVTAPGWANFTNPPAPPASLAATAGNAQVALNWTASSTATSYNLKRAVTSGGTYALLANVATTNFTDTAVVNGTNYYYVVSALNPAGESANSVPGRRNAIRTAIKSTPRRWRFQWPAAVWCSVARTVWPTAPIGYCLRRT